MSRISVLIVDDQALFRQGLRKILSVETDIDVIGEAANGAAAVEQVQRFWPQVVLMDLRMPILDGVAATRQIRAAEPRSQVIVLTTFDDDEDVFDALRAGAVGYLLKDAPREKLIEAIRLAARGESFLQPSIAARVVAEFSRLPPAPRPAGQSSLAEPLSERELDVLRHLAHGRSNKEIAAALSIAEGTAKNHMTSILNKLGVADRTQAALRARELGLA
jgi:DNA-binding NarL/FixJ family response regulator